MSFDTLSVAKCFFNLYLVTKIEKKGLKIEYSILRNNNKKSVALTLHCSRNCNEEKNSIEIAIRQKYSKLSTKICDIVFFSL